MSQPSSETVSARIRAAASIAVPRIVDKVSRDVWIL
jgi:hypothetical protein